MTVALLAVVRQHIFAVVRQHISQFAHHPRILLALPLSHPPHAIKEFSFSPQLQHQAVVSETPRSTSANSPGPISTRSPSPVSSAATALEKHREGPVAGPTLLDESVRLSQRLSELQGFRRRHSGQVF